MSVNMQQDGPVKFVAYYQIAGGILGITLWTWMVAHVQNISGIYLLVITAMILLEGFSVYCGRLVLKDTTHGLRVSAVNQAMQIISFAVNGFALKYVAGIGLVLGIDLTVSPKLTFNFSLSNLEITINREPDLIIFGVNVFAIYLLFLCNRLQAQLSRRAVARPPQPSNK